MIPTSDVVLPLLSPLAVAVPAAIRDGMEHADRLQPEPLGRDNHFWSHCARFYNKRSLATATKGNSWQLVEGVPNTGIHIVLNDVHRIRVLKSLSGLVPHPGSNKARRAEWEQPTSQGMLFLSAAKELMEEEPTGAVLPAMHLLIDWHQVKGEPVISVSLPKQAWDYQEPIQVHWRKPFPIGDEFGNVRFPEAPPANDDFGNLSVQVDPAERDAR